MTSITTYKCDRCGKTDTEFNVNWFRLRNFLLSEPKVDLCEDCTKKFKKFLKMEKPE